MKIKILTPNELGKFEFTKEELEKLLKEAYDDGYYDGINYSSVTTTTPYFPNITFKDYVTCNETGRVSG